MKSLTPVLLCLAAVVAFVVAGVVHVVTAPTGPAPASSPALVARR